MTVETELLRTPLYDRHVALGAKMVPFAGWEMPIQYGGIVAEIDEFDLSLAAAMPSVEQAVGSAIAVVRSDDPSTRRNEIAD